MSLDNLKLNVALSFPPYRDRLISAKTIVNWQKDKNGFIGLRLIDSTADLMAMSRKMFLLVFGKPDSENKERDKNNEFMTYSCHTVIRLGSWIHPKCPGNPAL